MVWFVSDPRTVSEKINDIIEPKRLIVHIQAGSFIAVYLLASIFLTWPSTSKDYTWISFGLIVYITGSFFAIWARFAMHKYWGVPAKHDDKRQTVLITSGPFSYSRNPIYVCIIMLFLGFSIALRSFSILLIPILVYTIYKTILIEEKLLHKKFGKEYEEYTKKVPRFI